MTFVDLRVVPPALRPATAPRIASALSMRRLSLDGWSERQTVLFVIFMGLLLYVPFAGSYGL